MKASTTPGRLRHSKRHRTVALKRARKAAWLASLARPDGLVPIGKPGGRWVGFGGTTIRWGDR